jgi:hypothetical protein
MNRFCSYLRATVCVTELPERDCDVTIMQVVTLCQRNFSPISWPKTGRCGSKQFDVSCGSGCSNQVLRTRKPGQYSNLSAQLTFYKIPAGIFHRNSYHDRRRNETASPSTKEEKMEGVKGKRWTTADIRSSSTGRRSRAKSSLWCQVF